MKTAAASVQTSSTRPSISPRCAPNRVRRLEAAERVLGDVLQRLVEGQDQGAEVADPVPPAAVAPPHHLDPVTLAGRPQPGDGPAGVRAEERVAPGGLADQDAAAPRFAERLDP